MKIKQQIFLLTCLLLTFNVHSQTFNLIWSDEFNGTGAPDPSKWGYELGYIRNNELQYYTNSTNNVRQYNGNLEITVRKETVQGNNYGTPATFNYTSGSVITLHKNDWVYGKIEGRFKMPKGKGLWSCFWTLGANYEQVWWPQCGEIDIFEHINSENLVHATAHWADASGQHVSNGNDSPNIDVTQWHTYSIQWTPGSIKWFVDDVQFHEVNILDGVNSTEEFHKPHYILINQPIGGSWPGSPDATTVLPATMYCDYIRVSEYVPEGSLTGNQFINCGGAEVGGFVADKWYSNGGTYSYNNTVNVSGVANAAPAAVYQSNRSGNLTYGITGLKPDSIYTTRLHFAENSLSRAGARLFNVKVNGMQVLTNFDIFVAAGNASNKAVVKDFSVVADVSGKIAIQLISITDNAQINGIEIFAKSKKSISITNITLPPSVTLSSVGEFTSISAIISPENATIQNLNWSSSNIAVATVSNTGVVTAISDGTSIITATSTDGSNIRGECIITVPTGISANNSRKIDPSSISIYPNPAKDNISIDFNDFDGNNPVDVCIFNINGKLIIHEVINDENHITIKINKLLNSGLYFIRVQRNIKSIIQKLIINEN